MQNLLAETVFSHTASPKKAAGRALGTMVEIISFYLIKAWGHEYKTAIEKPLPEYANKDITHNVEFTFHHNKLIDTIEAPIVDSVTSTRIFNMTNFPNGFQKSRTTRNLLKDGIVKNACSVAYSDVSFCNAYFSNDRKNICLYELSNKPYAMVECKRVGVEEGMNKGPQTIEKAKQGAYVARTVSSIQRIRLGDGRIGGVIERNGEVDFYEDYYALIENAILKHDKELLGDFILTVGIVSNHGNWFTTDNQNKEIKVLSQSYDWLLFLTDEGLSAFIMEMISGDNNFGVVKKAFEKSYEKEKKGSRFTKTTMDSEADIVLTEYFNKNIKEIESWLNVIAPENRDIKALNSMLTELGRMGV